MAFEGMDPDQIESLGRRLQGEANSLHSIMQQLDGLVNNMSQNWLGADSTRFQASYQQQYRSGSNPKRSLFYSDRQMRR